MIDVGFDPEDLSSMFLQNVGTQPQDNMAQQPRWTQCKRKELLVFIML
jgi:hypothetical protein